MVSVIIAATWSSLPFAILLFTVALQNIPQQYYEAAALDGASPWRTFTQITLPNIRWSILLITIFRLADAIKSFDLVYTLTGGGPGTTTQTLSVYIQTMAFTHSELGYAAALSLLILFISLVITSPLIQRLKIDV
jgi:multiple sugar transport system permease protein